MTFLQVIWMKKFIYINYMDFRFREKRKWCVSSKRVYIAWNKLQDNDIRSLITSLVVMVFWGVRHIIVVISRGLMNHVLFYYYMLMICWIERASIHESPELNKSGFTCPKFLMSLLLTILCMSWFVVDQI